MRTLALGELVAPSRVAGPMSVRVFLFLVFVAGAGMSGAEAAVPSEGAMHGVLAEWPTETTGEEEIYADSGSTLPHEPRAPGGETRHRALACLTSAPPLPPPEA